MPCDTSPASCCCDGHDRPRGARRGPRERAARIRQPHPALGRAGRARAALDARRRPDGVDGRALRPPAAVRRPWRGLPLHRRRRQLLRRLQPGRPQRDLRLRPARRAGGDRRARQPRAAVPAPGRGGDRGRRAARRALRAARLAVHALGLGRQRGGDPARPPPHRPRADRRLRRPLPRPPRRHARGGRRARRAAATLLGVNPRAAADTRVVPFNDLARSSACSRRGDVARRDHRARAHERRRRAPRRRLPRGHARAHARARRRCSCSTRRTRRPSPTAG